MYLLENLKRSYNENNVLMSNVKYLSHYELLSVFLHICFGGGGRVEPGIRRSSDDNVFSTCFFQFL